MIPLYELEGIRHRYNGNTVLRIDHLAIEQDGITGLLGPNGAGKSTLLALLALVWPPTTGTILCRGRDSRQLAPGERRSIVFLPQDPWLLRRSVAANLAYGLALRGLKEKQDARIEEALDMVGLPAAFGERQWYQLSGGEARRVALAARLVLRPAILILDEPTAGVDEASASLMVEAILHARQAWGTSLIIASHDRDWLNQVCDRRIGLLQGRLGSPLPGNLISGRWKMESGLATRRLPGGQHLVLKAPETDTLPAWAHIEPGALQLHRLDKATRQDLQGTVIAVRHQPDSGDLILDLQVSGLCLQATAAADQVRTNNFWPGTTVGITVDPAGVHWPDDIDSSKNPSD